MEQLAIDLGNQLLRNKLVIAVAESCTGGWLSKMITDVAGSSQWFDRGFITYTNSAKIDLLAVKSTTLEEHGAVSEQTVAEMAQGAIKQSQADLAIAISGVAGPGGGSEAKPVGTVCFAWARRSVFCETETKLFAGDREQVRYQAACHAISQILRKLAS